MFYLVYFTPNLPHHWVAWASDGQFYSFPTHFGGWRERELYHPRGRLTPALQETALVVAESSGQGTDKVRIASLDEGCKYPIPEAAAAAGINETALRSACWGGEVPGAMNIGRCWRLTARSQHHYITGYRSRPGASRRQEDDHNQAERQ